MRYLPVVVLVGLTALLLVSGIGTPRGSGKAAEWIGAFMPAAAFTYLTIRVARDSLK